MRKNQSANIAIGGIVSALALVLMFFTGVFPFVCNLCASGFGWLIIDGDRG